jgi:hypothetical protein
VTKCTGKLKKKSFWQILLRKRTFGPEKKRKENERKEKKRKIFLLTQ